MQRISNRQAEEMESVQAYFGEDVDWVEGEPAFTIKLAVGGVDRMAHISMMPGYPEVQKLEIEVSDLSVRQKTLLDDFIEGSEPEEAVITTIEELARLLLEEDAFMVDAAESASKPVQILPCNLLTNPEFLSALPLAGFVVHQAGSGHCAQFHSHDLSVTIESDCVLPGDIRVTWDRRVDKNDADEFLLLLLAAQRCSISLIPEALLSWVRSHHIDKDKGMEGFDVTHSTHEDSLPEELAKVQEARSEVIEELAKIWGIDGDQVAVCLQKRRLMIQSWGRECRNGLEGIDANFNACVLNAKGGEADASTMNGTYEEMQRKLIKGPLFVTWMVQSIEKIERLDCRSIGINCAHGRHRSVSAGEVLRKWFYPQSEHVLLEKQRVKNEKGWTGKPSK
mmetsp:Transcript_41729/g.77798  ORF Transcript_41729/g.77798 Transcript_41729/m.77798 type:complete len:394 (+) Transcript_41729:91-1272(+)